MLLRKYQRNAVSTIREFLTTGNLSTMLESPVGSGKTTTVKALAGDLLAAGAIRLVLVLVPQNMLKDQWAAPGKYRLGRRMVSLGQGVLIERVADLTPSFLRKASGVVILTRQALTCIPDVIGKLRANDLRGVLVVADEGHHCAEANVSGKVLAAMRAKGAATLLVSATPWSSAGGLAGDEVKVHRLSAASYVCAFEPSDHGRPPSEWKVDRVFVGAPVNDAELAIDRSTSAAKRKAKPERDEDKLAQETCKAMAERWATDGFPRAVFNGPRQFWRDYLLRELRRAWKAARGGAPVVLDLIGDMKAAELEAAQEWLRRDSSVERWGDIELDAVISCVRMDEGTDWVPCSHVYNAGIPCSAGLILQRWGRASRAKGKIEGYPQRWRNVQTLVFFTPPVTDEAAADAWQAHRESGWMLAGYIEDFQVASAWAAERVARGRSAKLPVPEMSVGAREHQADLAREIERRGGEMEPAEARAWLERKGASPEEIDTAVRRLQMNDPRHREAEERREAERVGASPAIREDLREVAAPLVAEFVAPLVTQGRAELALSFTALDAKQVAERMRETGGFPWPEGREALIAFAREHGKRHRAKHGKWPSARWAPIDDAPGATWKGLHETLGRVGLSLPEALGNNDAHRLRSQWNGWPKGGQALRELALKHGRMYHSKFGRWPTAGSGVIGDGMEATWNALAVKLRREGIALAACFDQPLRRSTSKELERMVIAGIAPKEVAATLGVALRSVYRCQARLRDRV